MKSYYVYILASKARGTLYVGVTSDLERRGFEHKSAERASFTQEYAVHRLVYYEMTSNIDAAIAREKQLKHWHRQWKINLIESMNPTWQDLWVAYRMDAGTSSA
jgi:putative endonuclease